MNKNSIIYHILIGIWLLQCFQPLSAADSRIELGMLGSLQSQTSSFRVEDASGFGLGARMKFPLIQPLAFHLDVHYDYQWLSEEQVLDIWEWDYWQDTYIDFIPGADVAVVNQSLTYTSSDSIYSARFESGQHLKELRLATGLEYRWKVTPKINLTFGLNGGVSIFYRTLQMREYWTKRFKLDTLSTGKFDYEFQYDLLHFAPAKKGTNLYLAPEIGTQIYLSDALDFNFKIQYLSYLHQKELLGLALSPNGFKWFPLRSKLLMAVGLTFKY